MVNVSEFVNLIGCIISVICRTVYVSNIIFDLWQDSVHMSPCLFMDVYKVVGNVLIRSFSKCMKAV